MDLSRLKVLVLPPPQVAFLHRNPTAKRKTETLISRSLQTKNPDRRKDGCIASVSPFLLIRLWKRKNCYFDNLPKKLNECPEKLNLRKLRWH
jgi:hypothetical protein